MLCSTVQYIAFIADNLCFLSIAFLVQIRDRLLSEISNPLQAPYSTWVLNQTADLIQTDPSFLVLLPLPSLLNLRSWPAALLTLSWTHAIRSIFRAYRETLHKPLPNSPQPIPIFNRSHFHSAYFNLREKYVHIHVARSGYVKPIFDGFPGPDMERVNTTERLARLRELMKQHKVDIYSM